MRKFFSLASLFLMFFLSGCGDSGSGNIPDFSTGDESTGTKPSGEDYIILAYVWSGAEGLPDPIY